MFEPRVAAASLSGESDVGWARTAAPYVGCAFLGGIALDDATRKAARKLCERDRSEFLPPDPIAFIDDQLAAMESVDVRPGMNVRSTTLEPIRTAAELCAEHGAILEINAHCRQAEMCAAGAGESLLVDGDRLSRYVNAAAETDATVSVKLRTEVEGVDLPALSARLEAAGSDILHVDAMDSEPVIAEVVAAAPDAAVIANTGAEWLHVDAMDSEAVVGELIADEGARADLTVIANNGVRGRETVREYLEFGADAVSVGRPSDDPAVLGRVREATEEWFEKRTTGRREPSPDA
jgi:TIM-barrel protein